MKVAQLLKKIDASMTAPIEREFVDGLSKFRDVSVATLVGKLKAMKLPKVDADEAASELARLKNSSNAFSARVAEMRSSRDYTKAVFFRIFEVLYPSEDCPPKSTKRDDLIDDLIQMRITQAGE